VYWRDRSAADGADAEPSPDQQPPPHLESPVLVPGQQVTAYALDEPDMTEMDASSPQYDALVEAHQRFAAFEADIAARGDLTQEDWAELEGEHDAEFQELLARSAELGNGGHPDAAETLLQTYGLLRAAYAAAVE